MALLSLHSSPVAPLGRSDAGGMNLYVHQVADELVRLGLSVDIFTRKTDKRLPKILELQSGARLVHLSAGPERPLPKHVLPLHIPALAMELRQFAHREMVHYDVLHCHYWLSGLVGMRARAALGAPVVTMFHTLSRLKEIHMGTPDRADSALRYDGERCVISGSDVVVGATSEELKHIRVLYGREPARFTVIPPGVDAGLFRPLSAAESRRKLHIEAERVILFVGRLDPLKGLNTLLRSVALLPEPLRCGTRVVVVGGRDASDRSRATDYRRMASALGIGDLLDMRRSVPQTELPAYFSAADVCAVPSAYESFGTVAIESMACETPVVAFAVGGLTTTITNGVTGFLAPVAGDQAYAACLARALECSGREQMGQRARRAVLRFNWSATARQTLELYENAVADRPCMCRLLAGAG
ncbi:MAG TPA: glycosyltransferase [Chloroflexota bacterium]